MLTLAAAKNLRPGDWLIYRATPNAKPVRWRVNGKPKVWKRDPERIQVPIKHGLYTYDYLVFASLPYFSLETE